LSDNASEPRLTRSISAGQGVALYVGAILGPGLLVLPAVAAETAGPASLIAWAFLIALSLPMALTFASLARTYPEAGGFSTYTERAFGRLWGSISGWLFFFCIPSGAVIAGLIAGQYGAGALGMGREAAYILGGLLVLLVFALNFAGLRLSGRVQVFVTVGVVALLAIATIASLPRVNAGFFEPFFSKGPLPVGLAAVQLFWAFAGWEAITPLAEEFRNPARDMWRATLAAVGIVGIMYGLLSFVTVGTHAYGETLQGAPPLGAMAAASFGGGAQLVVGIAGLFVSLGAINAYLAGTSRLGYALGRSRQLPSWFAALHPTWHSPHHALMFLCFGFLAWLLASYFFGLTVADLLPISTSSYLTTYVLSMAAGARLLSGWGRLAAIISLAACIVVLLFIGLFFVWIAGVTLACLAYHYFFHYRNRLPQPKEDSPQETY
jgi:amino acid efflux transporter